MINPDGQVWPCCYFANLDYLIQKNDNPPNGHIAQSEHPVYQDYVAKRDDYNAFKHPVEEILQSEWFTETLPTSWEGDDSDRHFLCIKHCEHDDP